MQKKAPSPTQRLFLRRPLTLACCAGLPPSAALSPQAGRGESRCFLTAWSSDRRDSLTGQCALAKGTLAHRRRRPCPTLSRARHDDAQDRAKLRCRRLKVDGARRQAQARPRRPAEHRLQVARRGRPEHGEQAVPLRQVRAGGPGDVGLERPDIDSGEIGDAPVGPQPARADQLPQTAAQPPRAFLGRDLADVESLHGFAPAAPGSF